MKILLLFLIGGTGIWAQVRIPGPGGPSSVRGGGGGGGGNQHEYRVTLAGSGQIPASQSNFSVLVCANMTLGNGGACPTATGLKTTANGGFVTNSSGYDIVFSSTACSSPTLMKWEMSTYTGSSGAMEAWVLNPSLAAGGVFYVCAGDSAITTFQGGAVGSEWDTYTQGVWHLPNGATLSAGDSSGHGNNGANGGGPGFAASSGQFDGGIYNSGGSPNPVIALPANMLSSNVATWTLWLNYSSSMDAYQTLASVFTSNADSMDILFNGMSPNLLGGNYSNAAVSGTVSSGTWHHVALTSNGSITQFYIDGVASGSTGTTNFTTFSATGGIGNRNGSSYSLFGYEDEVRSEEHTSELQS